MRSRLRPSRSPSPGPRVGSRKEHSQGARPAPHSPCPPPRTRWGRLWGARGRCPVSSSSPISGRVKGVNAACAVAVAPAGRHPGAGHPLRCPFPFADGDGEPPDGTHFPQGRGACGGGSWDRSHICRALIPGPSEAPRGRRLEEARPGRPVEDTDAAQIVTCHEAEAVSAPRALA